MTVKDLMTMLGAAPEQAEVVVWAGESEVGVSSIAVLGQTKVQLLPDEELLVQQVDIDVDDDDDDGFDDDDYCPGCGQDFLDCVCKKVKTGGLDDGF